MQRSPTQSVKVKTNDNIPQARQHNNKKPKGKKTPHRQTKEMEATKRKSNSTNEAAATGRRAQLPNPINQHSHTEHKKE